VIDKKKKSPLCQQRGDFYLGLTPNGEAEKAVCPVLIRPSNPKHVEIKQVFCKQM
jgi:hypothetical protein